MDYMNSDEFDCVAYVDEKTNNLVIRFFGIPNKQAAELFADYVMMTLGVDYQSINETPRSKMVN